MNYTAKVKVEMDFNENELQTIDEASAILNEMYLMVKDTHVENLTFDGTDYKPKDIDTALSLLCDILAEFSY